MYKQYNPNPSGRKVGDCVIRGVCFITDSTWEDTYIEICIHGYDVKDMPTANHVWEGYLSEQGFEKCVLPDTCPMCYTVEDFCNEHHDGVFLLATGSHVVAVKDGDYYDAWDSGNEVPTHFWKKKGEPNGL